MDNEITQYAASLRLAEDHGHWWTRYARQFEIVWGDVSATNALADELRAEEIADGTPRWMAGGIIPNFSERGALSHTTMTERLSWEITTSGHITITICRPTGPAFQAHVSPDGSMGFVIGEVSCEIRHLRTAECAIAAYLGVERDTIHLDPSAAWSVADRESGESPALRESRRLAACPSGCERDPNAVGRSCREITSERSLWCLGCMANFA